MYSACYFVHLFKKTEFSGHSLVKIVNIEAYEISSSRSKNILWRQTDGHKYRQAGVIKIIVNFRNFAKGLKCLKFQVA